MDTFTSSKYYRETKEKVSGAQYLAYLKIEVSKTRRVRPVVPRRRMEMLNRGHVANPNPIVPISPSTNGNGPKQREDGWMEIELGEYFIKEGEEGELEI